MTLPDTALGLERAVGKDILNALNAKPWHQNGIHDYVFCPTKGQPITGQGVLWVHLPVQQFLWPPALRTIAPYPQVPTRGGTSGGFTTTQL